VSRVFGALQQNQRLIPLSEFWRSVCPLRMASSRRRPPRSGWLAGSVARENGQHIGVATVEDIADDNVAMKPALRRAPGHGRLWISSGLLDKDVPAARPLAGMRDYQPEGGSERCFSLLAFDPCRLQIGLKR
jgi:hypothetical protein